MSAFIFDTETTGLVGNSLLPLESQPRIIEFFGFNSLTHEEIGFLCNPGCSLSDEITRITGLSDADLKGAAPFSFYADRVQSAIESADVVVAHNLSFDASMVDIEFKRLGRSIRWPRKVCTVEATEHIKRRRLRLSELYAHIFGETFSGAHRAKNDVMALAKVYDWLLASGEI